MVVARNAMTFPSTDLAYKTRVFRNSWRRTIFETSFFWRAHSRATGGVKLFLQECRVGATVGWTSRARAPDIPFLPAQLTLSQSLHISVYTAVQTPDIHIRANFSWESILIIFSTAVKSLAVKGPLSKVVDPKWCVCVHTHTHAQSCTHDVPLFGDVTLLFQLHICDKVTGITIIIFTSMIFYFYLNKCILYTLF